VQADGERLPFRDATFDAVLMVQVVGAARDWRTMVTEARRALRPAGALVLGHAIAPPDGIDAQMKQHLASLLDELGEPAYHKETRGVIQPWLEARAQTSTRIVAAEWTSERSPRGFLVRQQTGARFSRLPEAVRITALRKLAEWAGATFGSLDTAFREQHGFELQLFEF
jgi:SAM-dependent methyltransferase